MAAVSTIRAGNLILRLLQLCSSVIIFGIFTYFLALLSNHDVRAERWVVAVEGISGAATLYTLLGSLLTLKLGGIPFVAGLAMVLDFAFAAAFVALSIMTRNGTETCNGQIQTPIGDGDANQPPGGYGSGGFGTGDGKRLTYMPSLKFACRLQKVAFAVAIIGIFLFLISIIAQHLYMHNRGNAKTPSFRPSRLRSIFRFPRRRQHEAPFTNIELNQSNDGIKGTIPFFPTPSEEKPPQYAQALAPDADNSSSENSSLRKPQPARKPVGSGNNPKVSNAHSYNVTTYEANSNNPYTLGGVRNPDISSDYHYRESGVGTGGYAYGYGK